MNAIRGHHIRDYYFLIRNICWRISRDKSDDINILAIIELIVRDEFADRADFYKQVQDRGERELVSEDDALQYIGQDAENYQRFIDGFTSSFVNVIADIFLHPNNIVRIQTDPSDACASCWLANGRKFGKHCLTSTAERPENQKDVYYPLIDMDVVTVQSLAKRLGLEVIEEASTAEDGLKNMYIDVPAGQLRGLFLKEGTYEQTREILSYVAQDLKRHFEGIGQPQRFSEIYYVYNQLD